MKQRTIGIAGTAKNTGKTTTTNYILAAMRRQGLTAALTSIGYDGERLDNVTGLPKPRINVCKGTVVAVARRCLPVSTARVEVLEETDISTPLGPVVLGRVSAAGQMVVAGPNKSSSLRAVQSRLLPLLPDLILVDGALNRIAPMVETEGFILATGASRTQEIRRLAYEAHSMDYLFHLPAAGCGATRENVTLVTEKGLRELPFRSLFTRAQLDKLLGMITEEVKEVDVPGVIREELWKEMAKELTGRKHKLQLTFADPVKLALGGSAGNIHRLLEQLAAVGIRVMVKKLLPLLAVTVNPFYPRFRFAAEDYEPAFIDPEKLQLALSRALSVPAVNVQRNGEELLRVLGIPFNEGGSGAAGDEG